MSKNTKKIIWWSVSILAIGGIVTGGIMFWNSKKEKSADAGSDGIGSTGSGSGTNTGSGSGSGSEYIPPTPDPTLQQANQVVSVINDLIKAGQSPLSPAVKGLINQLRGLGYAWSNGAAVKL